MSEAVTELGGKVSEGWVTVRDAGLCGMISLRGDLRNAKLRKACTALTGVAFPAPLKAAAEGRQGLCWMSPDEVLILVAYSDVTAALATLHKALAGTHFQAKNVSDARTVMFVEGAGGRDVMAKLAPIDLHPQSFAVGDFRRTRLGQVAAAFWMRDETTFQVICFRSVGDYAFSLLSTSAEGGPVDAF